MRTNWGFLKPVEIVAEVSDIFEWVYALGLSKHVRFASLQTQHA